DDDGRLGHDRRGRRRRRAQFGDGCLPGRGRPVQDGQLVGLRHDRHTVPEAGQAQGGQQVLDEMHALALGPQRSGVVRAHDVLDDGVDAHPAPDEADGSVLAQEPHPRASAGMDGDTFDDGHRRSRSGASAVARERVRTNSQMRSRRSRRYSSRTKRRCGRAGKPAHVSPAGTSLVTPLRPAIRAPTWMVTWSLIATAPPTITPSSITALPPIAAMPAIKQSRPMTTLWAIWQWLSILLRAPTRVSSSVPLSMAVRAPISTSSSMLTPPVWWIFVAPAGPAAYPNPSAPRTAPACTVTRSPRTTPSYNVTPACRRQPAPTVTSGPTTVL